MDTHFTDCVLCRRRCFLIMRNGDDGASSFIPDIAHFELCSSINLCTKYVLIHFTQRHRLWLAAHGAKIITSHQTCERASERERRACTRPRQDIWRCCHGDGFKTTQTHSGPHVQRNRSLLVCMCLWMVLACCTLCNVLVRCMFAINQQIKQQLRLGPLWPEIMAWSALVVRC